MALRIPFLPETTPVLSDSNIQPVDQWNCSLRIALQHSLYVFPLLLLPCASLVRLHPKLTGTSSRSQVVTCMAWQLISDCCFQSDQPDRQPFVLLDSKWMLNSKRHLLDEDVPALADVTTRTPNGRVIQHSKFKLYIKVQYRTSVLSQGPRGIIIGVALIFQKVWKNLWWLCKETCTCSVISTWWAREFIIHPLNFRCVGEITSAGCLKVVGHPRQHADFTPINGARKVSYYDVLTNFCLSWWRYLCVIILHGKHH